MTISTASIVFMCISLLLSAGTPVALYLFWRKKYSLKAIPMLVGAAAFVLFAMILEQLLHLVVLRPGADGSISLMNTRPFIYMLYGCLAAGVFEETARFLSFKLLKSKYNSFGTGISYGIGHGGVEAVLIVGLTMISNIVLAVMVNSGTAGDIIPEQVISSLSNVAPHMFLIGGLERVMAITIQISLSILVYYSVAAKGKMWLYPAAILLHALIDVPAALTQAGVIRNIYLVEVIILLSAITVCVLAVFTHKKLEKSNEAQT